MTDGKHFLDGPTRGTNNRPTDGTTNGESDLSHIVHFHDEDEQEAEDLEETSIMQRMLRLLGFTKRNSVSL